MLPSPDVAGLKYLPFEVRLKTFFPELSGSMYLILESAARLHLGTGMSSLQYRRFPSEASFEEAAGKGRTAVFSPSEPIRTKVGLMESPERTDHSPQVPE